MQQIYQLGKYTLSSIQNHKLLTPHFHPTKLRGHKAQLSLNSSVLWQGNSSLVCWRKTHASSLFLEQTYQDFYHSRRQTSYRTMAVLKEVAHWRLKEAGEHTEPHPEAYCILCSLLKSEKCWRLEDSPARHPPVLLAFFPINLLLVHATTITGWRARLRCDNLPPSKVTSASQATNKKFTTVCAVLRLRQKNNRQSAETEGGSRGSRRFSSEEETGLSVRQKKR